MNKYHVEYLTKQRVQEAAALMTKSFLELNDLWKSMNPTYEQIYVWMKDKLEECIDYSFIMVNQTKNKMVGACINLDMIDYLAPPKNQKPQPKLFNFLSTYGKKLEENLYKTDWKRGQTIYSSTIAMDIEEASQGLLVHFIVRCCEITRDTKGYKEMYARISNVRLYKALQKIGADHLNQLDLDGQMTGKRFYLVKLDFHKKFPDHPAIRAKL